MFGTFDKQSTEVHKAGLLNICLTLMIYPTQNAYLY